MIKSPTGIKEQQFPYEQFQGLDDSRDESSQDTGTQQTLFTIDNGFCDWRGNIVKDAGAEQLASPNSEIKHIDFYGIDLPVWAEQRGGDIDLKALPDATKEAAFKRNSPISSCVFNNKVLFFAKDQIIQEFDGITFNELNAVESDLRPAFGVSIQNRLAVAGDLKRQGIVDISRVNEPDIFIQDEPTPITQVTAAGALDIRNIIGTNDEITGLGVFERNRLAIFTNDEVVVYKLSPDLTQWEEDDKGAISIGTFSHNTIANVGVDLIFANRFGIYSLRRSDANGVTLFATPLTSRIELLYRRLVDSVDNVKNINAFYDRNNGQYHIFFPQGVFSTRLTMTIPPAAGQEPKWSTSTHLAPTCGAALGGTILLGTTGGIWDRGNIEDEYDVGEKVLPTMTTETPILWNGSLIDTKESTKFVMQATGRGTILVEAFDEDYTPLQSWTQEIDSDGTCGGDDNYIDIPLSRQYERKFEHRYRGVRFRFTVKGNGLMKIIGFAVFVRK
jgi:hypothetical protein